MLRSLLTRIALSCLACLAAPVARAEEPLRFWAVTGSVRDVDMYKDLARRFRSETGIRVEVTPLAWGNFLTKYFASMAAGLPPDIGVTNLGGPFDYGSVGGLVDLRAEYPEETRHLEGLFSEGMLDMFTIGDALYGIPSDLSTLVVYYRSDIFRGLGLSPPETWSQLNALIRRLEANGYRYYFGFTAGAQWAIGLYTMPFGLPGVTSDPEGRPVVNWSRPEYQQGILQALRLWHMHDSPGRDLGNRVIGMFRSEEKGTAVPLLIDIHGSAGSIEQTAPELKGKWAVAPWPRADRGRPHNVMGGTAYVIFRKSAKKREAMRWLQFLNSVEAQRFMVLHRAQRGDESGLMISPVRDVWAEGDPFWQDESFRGMQGLVGVVRDILPTFRTSPAIQGAVEASRLEANLLDQMGTFIRDRLNAIGDQHNLTRSQVFQRFGSGALHAELANLEKEVADKLRAEYARLAPEAETILRRETARYASRYGEVIENMARYERQANTLDVVKVGAGGVLLLGGLWLLARRRTREHAISYLFIAPPIVLAVVFVFVPAVTALYLSFTDYHPVLPLSTAKWVGSDNYAKAVASGDLTSAIGRTLRYAVWTLPVGILLSLLFAYLLNSRLRGERYWRFLYFSPLVTSVVSIALIFTQLFLGGPQGWLNALLLRLGLVRDPVPFLTSEHTFLNAVIVLAIWHGLAFTILVFLAGLQQIPEEQFEAAAIDGAGQVKRFWNVAVPGLRPQLFFVTVLGLIGSFQVFETIYVLAGKSGDAGARFGPNDSALTMVPLIYHTGFETFEMGRSSAYAYILFVLILALTAIQFRFYGRKGAAS